MYEETGQFYKAPWGGTPPSDIFNSSPIDRTSLNEGERGEHKNGLKLNIKNPKIMASGPITSWQTEGEDMEAVTDFTFLGSMITADWDSSHEI